ncbi:MAG: tRNA pseudouridine(38-40) synthase TruA [Candidatus Eisenbacteria bacterium]|nr:tRNA pseudouridine(38-40) synthase TruA [Candidatus Eisenbacteria bacterium]
MTDQPGQDPGDEARSSDPPASADATQPADDASRRPVTRYRALVSYDGSRFHGWQIQPNVRTVQGEIQRVLRELTGNPVKSAGAGRTDTGVHALGQSVTFEVETPIPVERLEGILNSRLSSDVRLHRLEVAPPEFHARFSACSREYWYFLGRDRSPFVLRYAHVPNEWPDLDRMNTALPPLLGEHDFRALSAEPAEPYGCCLQLAEWVPSRLGCVFRVRSDRFLYRMVRFLVGASLAVGTGKRPVEWMGELLESKDRRQAAPPAPPQGLFFAAVGYEPAWPEEPLPLVRAFDAPESRFLSD